jgi:membrane protease YdiL (CAAX protease family)
MNAPMRAWWGVFASVLWAMCFRIGIQHKLLYPLLTPLALLLALVTARMSWAERVPGQRQGSTWQHIMLGVTMGVVTVVATRTGVVIVSVWLPDVLVELVRLQRIAGVHGAVVVCVAIIAVCEEFIWREGLQGAWQQRWGPGRATALRAILAAAAVYGLAQSGPRSLLLVATATGLGTLWGALRWWTGSLLPSLLAHLIWTIATVVIWPIAPQSSG